MQERDIEDILFGGSVLGKLVDILRHANQNLVENEVEKFILNVAALELMAEEKGITDKEINAYKYENESVIKQRADSIALTLTADILTQNE
jgi:hypothetical protein